MTVKKIEWNGGGYDLHLIAGTEIELLTIHFENGTTKKLSELVATDNVNVKFNWTLRFRLDDPDLDEVEIFGIDFKVKKGKLRIDNPLPTDPGKRVYNFIIEVTVEDNSAGNTFNSAVRIHVHDQIVDAWLTPSKLTIRHGSNGFRFSMLASFNDNVNGELFATPGDITRFSEFSDFQWKSNDETKVTVDSIGKLTANVTNANNIKISAVLPSLYFGNNVLEPRVAEVEVLPSWDSLSTEVRLVGRREISQIEIEKYPNLLLIAEGYKTKSEFENVVDKVVEEIKGNTTLMPFNLLSSSNKPKLNYWSVFIPSNDDLTTYLGLLLPFGDSEWLAGGEYFAVKPAPNDVDNEWTINELIYVVGMPLLSDYLNPQDDYDKKTDEWSKMFDTPNVDILRAKKVKKPMWERWKLSGSYGLANEKNTALGTCSSFRPNVDLGESGFGSILLNPFRTTREHLDQFLVNLKTKVKNSTGSTEFPIGERWASGPDSKNVIILCNISTFGGTQDEQICVRVNEVNTFNTTSSGTPQIDIEPYITIISSTLDIAHTVCHEFGHSLGLMNESGGLDSMPVDFVGAITNSGNVQAHSEIIDSSGGVIGINGKNIKWNWPRIMKAGVLKGYLPSGGTELKIRLDNDYKPVYKRDYFNTNNNVRFRQQILPTVETSMQEFHIDSIVNDPQGDILTLKPLNSEPFVEGDFPIGSLIIVTRPETLEFPDDKPYMRIIHKAVLNHINVTKRPLTAPPPPSSGNVTHDCVTVLRSKLNRPYATATQTPKNIPLLRFPKRRNHCTIVGVYEGGMDYECNVYHPSGYCNYRGTGDSFCHVCRYYIVDKLNPTLHRDVDHQYENIYPFR